MRSTSSEAGETPTKRVHGQAPGACLTSFAATGYDHGTKYAVEGISESLATELKPLGIGVLIVEPGPFRTNWAGPSIKQSAIQIDAYAATAGERRKQTAEGLPISHRVWGANVAETATLASAITECFSWPPTCPVRSA